MTALAFVTGAAGLIGAEVTLQLLQAGYNVRLSLRRESQVEKMRRVFSPYLHQLEFVIVPDITVAGCFDEALEDVQDVIHVASPLLVDGDLFTPAVRGTLSILESALITPSVRKVVVTASMGSFTPLTRSAHGMTYRESIDIDFDHTPEELAQFDVWNRYLASKAASYRAVIDFVRDYQPPFDVVTIHPGFTHGRSVLQERPEELRSTNAMLFQSIVSNAPYVGYRMGSFLGVHVDDVAAAHVKALDPNITGFEQYFLCGVPRPYAELVGFLRKEYPHLPVPDWPAATIDVKVDASKAERELGIRFKSMEEQLKDLMDQQLGMLN